MQSIHEIKGALERGEISSEQLVMRYLARIEEWDPKLGSFVALNPRAVELAKTSDELRRKNMPQGALAGIPLAMKDMICTRGLATTAGSKILRNYCPPYSATLVERLEAEGAIVLGKNNQDEFAMGASTETSAYGLTRNPWSLEYVSGGSSGGSAAAVAAGLVPASIGTDTGGSVRQPASFCGVVGVKPTYGRISRYGVIAYASSLDQAGPLALNVEDAALLLEVMSGFDARDATSSRREVPRWSSSLSADVRGKRIGVFRESFGESVAPEVQRAVRESSEILRASGAIVEEISLATFAFVVPAYYLIAMSEASSNLARYDGIRFGHRTQNTEQSLEVESLYAQSRGEGFGTEVKRRILLGTYALSQGYYDAYYLQASRVRRLISQEFEKAFAHYEVLLGPVSATPAFRIGERITDPLQMYANDVFTASVNLAGLPALSLPARLSSQGLPIGVQLVGAPFAEQSILDAALSLQRQLGWKQETPHGLR